MSFKNTSILKCCEGDVLASDVYSKKGNALIVTKETVINDYIKDQMMKFGVTNVFIYENKSNVVINKDGHQGYCRIYKETILGTKRIFQDIVMGNALDYKRLSWLAEQIQFNMNDSDHILKCITEVKSTDEYTYIHSINVAFYSMMIAKWMRLSKHEIRKAIISGLLHDIGKIKIPDEILNKPGKLTNEEFDIIKNHTIYGYDIVNDIDEIDIDIKNAILLHHERMDGSGYPFNYNPKNLNVYARIVAIADVFDAMTSERVYKRRYTPFEVFEMFQKDGIGIFDIKMLYTFMKNLANYMTGMEVLLSNGEIGKIVFVPLQDIIHPIINTSDRFLDLNMESRLSIVKIIK